MKARVTQAFDDQVVTGKRHEIGDIIEGEFAEACVRQGKAEEVVEPAPKPAPKAAPKPAAKRAAKKAVPKPTAEAAPKLEPDAPSNRGWRSDYDR